MMMAHTRLDIGGSRGGIWMMRAWREGRAAGKGRAGAVLGIFPAFFRYTANWLRLHVSLTFAPLGATSRTAFSDAPGPVRRFARRLLAPLLIPQALVLALLLVLQVLLKSVAVALTTGLASVTMLVAGILWVVSKVVMIVLWLPLTIFERVFNACRDAYTVSLRAAIPFGPVFLVITLAVAVHAAYVALDLGRELIPPLKQGEFGIRMEAPPGTRLEQTVEQASPIEAAALGVPEIETVTMAVGSDSTASDNERGENTAQFTVRLRNPKENAARQDEIIATLRERVQGLTTNPVAFTLPTLFSFKTAVELQVRGDNLAELRRIGLAARDAIADIPGLKDPELSMKRGYPEVILRMDPVLLADRGLTADQVAQRLRTEVQGDVSTRFSRGGEKVDIRVLTDRTRLNSLDDLRALSITEGDRPIPLDSVAEISVEDGPSEIRRIDQRQVAVITANVEGRDLGAVAADIEARVRNIPRPRDYQFVLGGQNRELAASYKSLQFALMLAIFLVYVVMACQFESLHHPALVMFSVPLALIGVAYGLLLTGIPVSIMVFIGGIVLAGIVVNDAIILVDYINQLRARGIPKREAVIQAGRVRMRPILMTTLTTILGLVPMAFQGAEGAEIRRPMAITIIAGEISSTLLILFIIPMIYDLLGGRDRT
jgi:hydrophobic/amphiphilic exporter-1 (mainly G- bacteria), HAE1 family